MSRSRGLRLPELDRASLRSGTISGFATGVFSIPEGMAYAQLAGVNPLYGIYSGMVATFVASLTTGSVLMISTLTSAIALSSGSVLDVAGIGKGDMPQALFTVTLLTGAVMLGLGLARLGNLVSFVSNAVMTGFVAGASMLILIGQLGDFSGYEPDGSNKVVEAWDWITHAGEWDVATTVVAVATVVLLLGANRIPPLRKLAPIAVLIVVTIVVALVDLPSVKTVGDIASIPSGFPSPQLPDFSRAGDLALGSVSVAIVALVQGAGISTAYQNPDGSAPSPSRDFIGQGLGNLAGAFFQSMPTGGSLSRTGVAVSGGSRSRLGGVFAAIWLAVLVLAFGSAAEAVPLSVIAGLLVVIAAELIVGRLPNARLVLRSSLTSTAAMAITFATALLIPLQWTIFIGAGLSLVVYIGVSFRAGTIHELVRNASGYWSERAAPTELTGGRVTVLGLRDWRFYADVPRLARQLPAPGEAIGAVVIVRMRDVTALRATGLRVLDDYRESLQRSGNALLLAGVRPAVLETLRSTGIADRIGSDNIFVSTPEITRSLDEAWGHARRLAVS